MEQESVAENLNAELLELPPLKDMKEIISEYENSGVANEPSIFNIDETDSDQENFDCISSVKETLIKKTKNSEFEILDETEISKIDFEISKDIFDEIKIKDEHIITEISRSFLKYENNNKEQLSTEKQINYVSDSSELHKFNSIKVCKTQEIDSCDFIDSETKIMQLKNKLSDGDSSVISDFFKVSRNENSESNENIDLHIEKKEINSCDFTDSEVKLTQADCCTIPVECLKVSENTNSESNENVELHVGKKEMSITDSVQSVIESVIEESMKFTYDKTVDKLNESKICEMDINLSNENHVNDSILSNDFNKKIPMKKKTYGIFEVIVPLIGKNIMEPRDDKPFTGRYDLAIKRNELRAKYQQKHPESFFPNTTCEEWRRQRESRTQEQIDEEKLENTVNAMQLGKTFTKIAIVILEEYQKDNPNEAKMIRFFKYFECAPASPLSLLYSPHLVHTIMLCRGDADRSPKLRRVANDCYDKCHALFPIPEGYNFETVFTSEVKKNIPDEFDHLEELELNYGDYDSSDCESDHEDDGTDSAEHWD